VRLRGLVWTIGTATAYADCVALRLNAAGSARTILTPFDRPQRLARPGFAKLEHPRRWLHALRRAAVLTYPYGGIADPPQGVLNLLPYQLEPALAFLRHGATRVLVADGVGLGKTIQSGLLLYALRVRTPSLRALIVTPAGLREQWAGELSARFGMDATVADASWLRRSTRALPSDVAPWALPGIFIVSFDFLKRPEVLRPVEDLAWDLLVVDEAHNLTMGSARRTAVHGVARRSMRVLLLTATPHAGDTAGFVALCSIGATAAAEPIMMFRRSRADAGIASARRSVLLTVRPSAAERTLHRLIDRYTTAICRDARGRGDARARLLAVVLKKRALSSAGSVGLSIRRRMDLLGGAQQTTQLLLPLGDEEPLGDDVDDETLAAPGLGDSALERHLLERIARAAGRAASESKTAFLLRMLRRMHEPAIVFTEYRDTVTRLHELLTAAGHDVTLLHGALSPAERAHAQARFNAAGGVLLATDAAAEGLNLHERCRLIVHYELPWTPARLEQRAGRVDRIGQRATVHEVLLVAGHPAERLVLAPLARRAARARSALGTASRVLDRLAESAVADAVLDGVPLGEPAVDAPSPTLLCDVRAEAQAEAARLAERREWTARSAQPMHRRRMEAGVLVTRMRRRPGRRATRIYDLRLSSPGGRIEHCELIAVRGDEGRNVAAVLAHLSARIEAVRAMHARVRRALAERAAAVGADAPSTSRALVQAGLFDRRALRALQDRARVAERLAKAIAHEAQAAETTLTPELNLVAVLLA
jgi:superfamily II DNA or RNA helicase